MPDIVSRIRLEAQGADQAAREIRKLRDAYNEVAQAGRGISPAGVGADPFAQAVSAPGGGVYGGQRAPADIVNRETRGRNYRNQVSDREKANSDFNASMRRAPGGVTQAMGTAEAAATGRGGTALGQMAGGLGALLGGPVGLGLLAGGAIAMGAQKFADNAYDRMQNIWGAGISQRVGRTYEDIQTVQTAYGRTGIPIQMVQQFFQAASQAGVNMNRPGALETSNVMMEAMASMGVDPGAAANLMGQMTRGGLGMEQFDAYNLFGRVSKTFGRENVSMYLQEMARGINQMATQGIDITEEAFSRQTNLIGAFTKFGGMTPEGAIALNQQMMGRGISAAQLQRPEDIIAFQSMRGAGMSVTDAMLAMEQNPDEVNRRVYQYLKGATGGQEDILRLRLQEYMGGNTTMSAVVDFINTMEGIKGKSNEELSSDLGGGTGWIGRYKDESGKWVYTDKARELTAIRQSELFRGIEKSALDLTTGMSKTLQEFFKGPISVNALNITWAGYVPTLRERMETNIPPDQPGREVLLGIRTDKQVTESLVNMLQAAGVTSPYATIEEASTFGWRGATNEIMASIARGMVEDTLAAKRRDEEGLAERPSFGDLRELMRSYLDKEILNQDQLEALLRSFIEEAQKRGYVLTDGEGP